MKKILVVDDEPLIAKGVATLISGYNLPLEVTDVCLDSEEALSICRQKKIDVIVTDINMPNLNGIELIKVLKELDNNLEIIILTGFGSFTYAKEAMALGVRHFLEKPLIPGMMYEAVRDCLVLAERKQEESKLYQRRQIERFLSSSGRELLPESLTFPLDLYLFDSRFYPQLAKISKSYREHNPVFVGHHSKVGYLLNSGSSGTLESFLINALEETPLGKGIAIHCQVQDAADFLLRFYLGKRNLDKEFYFEEFQIINQERILREKVYENQIYVEFREKLLQYLNQGELTRAQVLTETFFDTCRCELYPVQLLRLQINELLTTIFELYPVKRDSTFDDYSPKIMLLNDWQELAFMLMHCIDLMRSTLSNQENMKLSHKVNLIIEEYYDRESLSLKWIANRLLYLNPEYLGKTYYKETKVRFNTKLAEYRIGKAQELLQHNYKVYEVAAMTGFGNSPEYFVQTFKKITGITPKQFVKQQVPV